MKFTYRYFIKVYRVDNQIKALIGVDGNLNEFYKSKYYNGDPFEIDEPEIEFTGYLQPHVKNELVFKGYNGPRPSSGINPWHFEYYVYYKKFDTNGNIVESKEVVPGLSRRGPNDSPASSWEVFEKRYIIVFKDDEYSFMEAS